jgi:WD40 repeat protein
VATHRPIGNPLTGHTGAVFSVAFSRDGTTVASGSADVTVRLWDVATHRQIGNPLTGHADGVLSVAFGPDGTTLASSSQDHTVRLWDVGYLVDVVRHLCESTTRSFTPAEWRKYVPPGAAYRQLCP